MIKRLKPLLLFTIVLFIQCNDRVSQKDSDLSVNEFIYYTMKDIYLWYDKIPKVDYELYDDPVVLFESLLYKEYDKWSFMLKTDDSVNIDYDEAYGYGFYPIWVNESTDDLNPKWLFKVAYVKPGSPADNNSLQRGDSIIHINNLYLANQEPSDTINELINEEIKKDESLNLHIITKTDQDISISLDRGIYNDNPIYYDSIIYQDNKKIGYLVFNTFDYTGNSSDDDDDNDNSGLDNVIKNFDNNNIDELIIDLRYNGGGSLSVANHFASLICGEEYESKIFNKSYLNNRNYENYFAPFINSFYNYVYNEADTMLYSIQPNQNYFTYKFKKLSTSLNISRIIFLVSDLSASASEALIMGLKPFVDVVLIGENTHGKPVGMISIFYKGYVFYPIMFKGYNAIGEGEFFSGIEVDKVVHDDVDHNLGDVNEARLNEALFYIKNNYFSPQSKSKSKAINIPLQGLNWINKSF